LRWFQGGDGFFNEILNGFLSPRLKAPYPPTPPDFVHLAKDKGDSLVVDETEVFEETSSQSEDQFPLISSANQSGPRISNSSEFSLYLLQVHFLYFCMSSKLQ